ncbi:hypothetical protein F4814DRAFT_129742 [Daldinia grandis]|nr:hypothetical protein F4814DRAFT_129742 [Daldinia grandis]
MHLPSRLCSLIPFATSTLSPFPAFIGGVELQSSQVYQGWAGPPASSGIASTMLALFGVTYFLFQTERGRAFGGDLSLFSNRIVHLYVSSSDAAVKVLLPSAK